MSANGHERPLVKEIALGGGRTIVVPAWVETTEQKAERVRLIRGRFFLISTRGGGLGERLRCKRCKGRHPYLTHYCLEQPFSGLLGSLWAYMQTASAAASDLDSGGQARLQAIAAIFDARAHVRGVPDLANSHPQTARMLRRALADPGSQPGHLDIDMGAVAVGIIERIERADAQKLLDRINTRAALYRLPKLNVEGLVTR